MAGIHGSYKTSFVWTLTGGRLRKSWINIINAFREVLIVGSRRSGKSYFIIQHPPTVYAINFDDRNRSHRCNPSDPTIMNPLVVSRPDKKSCHYFQTSNK